MRVILLISFLALVNISQSAYATNTNAFYGSLTSCVVKTNSDIDCVTDVKDGLQKMSTYIQNLRNLKNQMQKISNGLNTLKTITTYTKYIPKVGAAIKVLDIAIKAARPAFDSAFIKVKAIDKRVYAFKPKADAGVRTCNTGIRWLNIVKSRCAKGRAGVGAARSCVNVMSGNLKATLGNKLEDFGGALNPSFSQMVRALGNIGSACSAVKRISDITLGWPDIGPIIRGIDDVYDALKPILDFFARLEAALTKRLCIPDPIEALAETELIEELKESPLNPGNWGRRRRSVNIKEGTSSTALKRISEQEANTYLRRYKRANTCFSVKAILDGIDSIFAPLVDLANKAIAAVLKLLPSFSLPGFPNFSNIFRINFSFNLPTVDFGLDLDFFGKFEYIRWDCSAQVKNVCQAGRGVVTFNCGKSLDSYKPSGKKRRAISDNSLTGEEEEESILKQ